MARTLLPGRRVTSDSQVSLERVPSGLVEVEKFNVFYLHHVKTNLSQKTGKTKAYTDWAKIVTGESNNLAEQA